MDDSRFDAWTRRRFGLAVGGTAALVLNMLPVTYADAKKKKKRCRRIRDACKPGGKRKCCNTLVCLPSTFMGSDYRCCKKVNAPCAKDDDCCTLNCSLAVGCQPQE